MVPRSRGTSGRFSQFHRGLSNLALTGYRLSRNYSGLRDFQGQLQILLRSVDASHLPTYTKKVVLSSTLGAEVMASHLLICL